MRKGKDMRKQFGTRLLAGLLTLTLVMSTGGCSFVSLSRGKMQAENLMEGIVKSTEITVKDDIEAEMGGFAFRLFQESYAKDKNTLISPLSVLMALAMTANGAKGDTLEQMQEVMGYDIGKLNGVLFRYMKNLPQGEKYKLKLANSIWFTQDERFTVNQDFLQLNANYYDADVYRAPFDDSTLQDINLWIENETDGMIKQMLNQIPSDAVMYLINALAFEAEWLSVYEESQVRTGSFTTESGQKHKAEMMYSDENIYLENSFATGFVKPYKDRKYAFVAVLPKKGVTMEECVSSMTAEAYREFMKSAQEQQVDAAIPEFQTEFDVEMSELLQEMGMTDAFSPTKADFSGLGHSTAGNIAINRILHKSFIQVGPQGTKAGAATVVEMIDECAPMPVEKKKVYLDRPFMYMLIDCENNQPFFIGTVLGVEAECGLP